MNSLQVLDQREVLGNDFRIYGTVDNPLFLAKSVSEWIDYSKNEKGVYDVSKMLKTVDESEKLIGTIFVSGQNREMWFLTEDGVYEVLMQSRKKIAKQFKKQVKEILKTIRKTGGYVDNDDKFIDTYLPFADDATRMMFKGTLEVVRKQNEVIDNQKKEIESKNKVIEIKNKEIEYKEDVIVGLVEDIDLATQRQILNKVVRKVPKYQERWSNLYDHFEMKFHMNLKLRLENYNKNNKPKLKSKLSYIDTVLGMIPDLYEIAAKLYENDVKQLVEEIYGLNRDDVGDVVFEG